MPSSSKPIRRLAPLLLGGPTAVGKSEVAIGLAERLGGEIVSVDSMQVYRGLDIGTAKPLLKERGRVPHHLIDAVDITESFDAAQFVRLAWAAVSEIQARGRTPILCGGTGLYFRAFLEGLGKAPPADPALRAELEAMPLADLLRELKDRDPTSYERIDRQNPRRVVRAVEVIRLTGKAFSEQRAEWAATSASPTIPAHPGALPQTGGEVASSRIVRSQSVSVFVALARTVPDLRKRIDVRVEEMFRGGLVEETEQLLKCGLAESRTAMQALGYRQVVEYLHGERSLPETMELVRIRTRQFARRQMTWFKKQAGIQWVQIAPDEDRETVVEKVIQLHAARTHD